MDLKKAALMADFAKIAYQIARMSITNTSFRI